MGCHKSRLGLAHCWGWLRFSQEPQPNSPSAVRRRSVYSPEPWPTRGFSGGALCQRYYLPLLNNVLHHFFSSSSFCNFLFMLKLLGERVFIYFFKRVLASRANLQISRCYPNRLSCPLWLSFQSVWEHFTQVPYNTWKDNPFFKESEVGGRVFRGLNSTTLSTYRCLSSLSRRHLL